MTNLSFRIPTKKDNRDFADSPYTGFRQVRIANYAGLHDIDHRQYRGWVLARTKGTLGFG
jgi:hypothetical protein